MKVVRIIARLNVGGPARHVTLLADRLSGHGFDTLLVFGSVDRDEASLEPLAAAGAGRWHKIPWLGRAITPLDDLRAFLALLRLILRERPDVIHTHTAKAGVLGRLAGAIYNASRRRARRAFVVHTFHGHVLSGYFGRLGSALARLAERSLAHATDAIVAISALQRDDLVRVHQIAPPSKVHVIELGLDLRQLLELAPAEGGPVVRFGYIGRLVPIKNLAFLVRAFHLAVQREPALRLRITGDGALRQALEQQVAALALTTFVEFTGWQQQLALVYSDLDAVVLSSINEGTPVALIEALAAARPVLATDAGGVRDVVSREVGIIVESGNERAFADALVRLAADAGLRRAMGLRGREMVRRRYAPDRLAADVASLYRSGLATRRFGAAPAGAGSAT